MKTTYRLIVLGEPNNVGQTAATPEFAMLAPGDLDRSSSSRLAIEQTDWTEKFDKLVVNRSVIIDVEPSPGKWTIGS